MLAKVGPTCKRAIVGPTCPRGSTCRNVAPLADVAVHIDVWVPYADVAVHVALWAPLADMSVHMALWPHTMTWQSTWLNIKIII